MARPLPLEPYFHSVRYLTGVGPRLQPLLLKLLGGECLIDLLLHAPTDVIDRRHTPPLADIVSGEIVTLKAMVKTVQHAPKGKPTRVVCHHPDGFFELVYFNAPKSFLEQEFPQDRPIVLSGKAERYGQKLQFVHPDIVADIANFDKVAVLEPVYPLTQGLTNRRLHTLIVQALQTVPPVPEWLDPAIMARENWLDWRATLDRLHRDGTSDPAIWNRLAYDEALAEQVTMAIRRERGKARRGRVFGVNDMLRQTILRQLPYELTGAQKRTLNEIDADMGAPERMLRLVQGDVGSGKTIVAFLAMLNATDAGAQAAMMAPTEILAQQHFKTLEPWCMALGLKLVLRTGRSKSDIQDADMVIGTHALFQDAAIFRDLGLAVIDEQHRFGVEQRLKLSEKGFRPDVLIMTATPIPRSLTLALYGDMDVSKIDEKPPIRRAVTTKLIHVERMGGIIAGLKKKLEAGERVFWVCPLIEESMLIDLAAAQERAEALQHEFPGRVGLLHGRMKADEKEAVMQQFVCGDLSILVATTVIEVGVNVPEATVMIVEQAERFGLAQLHQLRGRVGRGDQEATCLLLYKTPIGQTARERLQILRDSDDGFVIAEKDLELRGGGEILGTRQSGLPAYKFLDLVKHQRLIAMAQQEARMIVASDPRLISPRGEALRNMLYLHRCDAALQLLGAG